ncbi:MAG TPA: hypothetical protein VFZ53_08655, partial [Polyangiaceae bacterium]
VRIPAPGTLGQGMSAIGKLGDSVEVVGLGLAAGVPPGEAIDAQRLAESYIEMGEWVSAVSVLTEAAVAFSDGRFPPAAVELLRSIVRAEREASPLRAIAETRLERGERKHLVAAVCLLGMAHEHDRADTRTLELLVRAFEKMGLEDKARKVEAVLTEMAEEEPTLPAASDGPLSPSTPDD